MRDSIIGLAAMLRVDLVRLVSEVLKLWKCC
jgi:hypothetical protein